VVTCTFSHEAVCDDGADGDGDGLIDGADPDCCIDIDGDGICQPNDCDDTNPLIQMAPADEVEIVLTKKTGGTEVSWETNIYGLVDVATGSLSDMRADTDFFQASCLVDDDQGQLYADLRADPSPGDGYYYLARSQNSCGSALYGNSAERIALESSPGACPYDPACPTCADCELTDPAAICEGLHCLEMEPNAICATQPGTGLYPDPCNSESDCAEGHGCFQACVAWCRIGQDDCGFGFQCVPFNVSIGGTAYGVCLPG